MSRSIAFIPTDDTGCALPAQTEEILALATFEVSQPTSSVVQLDATDSIGSLAWQLDGNPRPETATVVQYGPLSLGPHTIGLTATDENGNAVTLEQTVNVAWYARPLYQAQHDVLNGSPAGTKGYGLPKWPLAGIGPWRNIGVFNENAPGYVPPGDGIDRLIVFDDEHVALRTRYGDKETPQTSGGYRSCLEWNYAYDGSQGGLPCVQPINLTGMGKADGVTGSPRIYHIEYMLPSVNPDGSPVPKPLLYQNNVFEIHGNISGSSPFRVQTDGAGLNWLCCFESIRGGVSQGQKNLHRWPIAYDQWEALDIEILWDLRCEVGYVKVTHNGQLITSAMTDPDGCYWAPYIDAAHPGGTQQTDKYGRVVPLAFDIQNYRTAATMPPDYPDVTIHYRNISVAPVC